MDGLRRPRLCDTPTPVHGDFLENLVCLLLDANPKGCSSLTSLRALRDGRQTGRYRAVSPRRKGRCHPAARFRPRSLHPERLSASRPGKPLTAPLRSPPSSGSRRLSEGRLGAACRPQSTGPGAGTPSHSAAACSSQNLPLALAPLWLPCREQGCWRQVLPQASFPAASQLTTHTATGARGCRDPCPSRERRAGRSQDAHTPVT